MYKLLIGHLHPQASKTHVAIVEGILNQEQVRSLEQVALAFRVKYTVRYKDDS